MTLNTGCLTKKVFFFKTFVLEHLTSSFFQVLFSRSKIVKFHLETKSLVQTQRKYRKLRDVKQASYSTTIKKIVQKFKMHGTCHNKNKENSGRTARTKMNVDIAQPKKTITEAFVRIWLCKIYCSKNNQARPHTYVLNKLEIEQSLTDKDQAQRFQMCT